MKFLEALKKQKESGRIPVIPDIKCYSPKDGDLLLGRDPVDIAECLYRAGACAVSVVTEEKEFHGSLELLKKVCERVRVPVLRKDFITDEKDLDETLKAGADAILLMVSCLGEEKLEELYHAAIRRGLTPFVETHTDAELAFAQRLGAPLIGINNRNILILEKDDGTVATAQGLLRKNRPKDAFIIVESAIGGAQDVRKALNSGADGVLAGTAILSADDPAEKLREMSLCCSLKICGLQSGPDVEACLENRADMCGFVVDYPVNVRWNISPETAKPLIDRAKKQTKTCVVTGGDYEKVMELARFLKPDYIQLHYRENKKETQRIAAKLKKENIGVIRSVPKDPGMRQEMFGTKDLETIIRMLNETDIEFILLDSRDASNAAAGGGSILSAQGDQKETAAVLNASQKRIMIGGGITPENAGEIISLFRPDYIDIMTGAEDESGNKSPGIIRQLAGKIR